MPKKTVEERFWEKVGPHTDPNVCWIWQAGTVGDGHHSKLRYGVLRIAGKNVRAHRLSYEMHYHVTIPEGMTIDHVKARGCTSTLCVNPHHLEVVTSRMNVLRGSNMIWETRASRTHCPKGHPYNKGNTYVCHGHRQCRVCGRERCRERYHAKKAYHAQI